MSSAVEGTHRAADATDPSGPKNADAPAPRRERTWQQTVQEIGTGRPMVIVLSFVLAFLAGSVLIAVSDPDVRAAATYFFARPSDTFTAVWESISGAYAAMFRGSIFDMQGYQRRAESIRAAGGSGTYVLFPALAVGFRPLTETLTVATPLIIAATGVAVAFRAGLFNIGGTGQVIMGTIAAGYVGFALSLPPVIHLLVALIAGTIAGALWGGLAGFLKARFEANEVISTIMLNWIATYLLFYALKTPAFTGANSSQPTSPSVKTHATLPLLLGEQFRLHWGLLFAVGAIVLLWWLMNRSTLGFRFRAVGSNPRAAEVAGISSARASFGVMLVAGGLVGLAGAVHILGTEKRLTEGIAGSLGFDAITVALLGSSGPIGILLAGLLFAALSTGGRFMETNQGVPLDLVQVVQALVVLFIAAPPLVRTIFGMNRWRREQVIADPSALSTAASPVADPTAAHAAPLSGAKQSADPAENPSTGPDQKGAQR